MQSYYLYRLSFTGATLWKYVRADQINEIGEKSNDMMSALVVPDYPIDIASKQYGNIRSEFDYDSTLVPGLTRYGRSENHTEVFALQWKETEYILKVRGYLPIHISGKEIITFTQGDKEIARMISAPTIHIVDEFTEAVNVKQFEIDSEYIPILEILGSFMELQFAF